MFLRKRGYVKLYTFILITSGVGLVWARDEGAPSYVREIRKEIHPSSGPNPVAILTQSRRNVYYQLRSGNAAQVEIAGPGELTIVSRRHFEANTQRSAPYQLLVSGDGEGSEQVFKKTQKSYVSRYEGDLTARPGKIRNVPCEIPSGVHSIAVSVPNDADYRVNVRFLFKETPGEENAWRYVQPSKHSRGQKIGVAGKTRVYFPIAGREYLGLEMSGPAQLRFMTRWQGGGDALTGKGAYKVMVYENAGLKLSKEMQSAASREVRAENEAYKEAFVGQAEMVYINVPAGSHQYRIFADGSPGVKRVLVRPFVYVGEVGKSDRVSVKK